MMPSRTSHILPSVLPSHAWVFTTCILSQARTRAHGKSSTRVWKQGLCDLGAYEVIGSMEEDLCVQRHEEAAGVQDSLLLPLSKGGGKGSLYSSHTQWYLGCQRWHSFPKMIPCCLQGTPGSG
jgi:hypothetical protein